MVCRVETFVVRLREPDPDADTGSDALRGVLEHVASGESHVFRGGEHLAGLLIELAGRRRDPADAGAGGPA